MKKLSLLSDMLTGKILLTEQTTALSPADINYEETLSTLRYADRLDITNRTNCSVKSSRYKL